MMPPRMRSCLIGLVTCLSVVFGFVASFLALAEWLGEGLIKQFPSYSDRLVAVGTAALLIGTIVCGVLGWRWAKDFFERFK